MSHDEASDTSGALVFKLEPGSRIVVTAWAESEPGTEFMVYFAQPADAISPWLVVAMIYNRQHLPKFRSLV